MKLFAGENAKLNDVSNGLFSLGPTEVGWGLGWSNKYTLNNDEVLRVMFDVTYSVDFSEYASCFEDDRQFNHSARQQQQQRRASVEHRRVERGFSGSSRHAQLRRRHHLLRGRPKDPVSQGRACSQVVLLSRPSPVRHD